MDNPSAPPGKSTKYARPEVERRWLLEHVPAEVDAGTPRTTIADRYLAGTTLRLRRADDPHGSVYKLTQKIPGPRPSASLLTTMYVTSAEYAFLAELAGDELRKVRYALAPYAIDVFDEPLDGLVLAEVEVADDLAHVAPPPGAIVEVTDDPRYAGAALARDGRPA